MERPVIVAGSRNIRRDVPKNGNPAAIRYCNPGAMWPNALAERYGMLGYGQLNDGDNQGAGNRIALFPNAIYGAAACMALLATSPRYLGKTISEGQYTWSGSKRTGLPGWNGDQVITAKMVADPAFVIPFMKSIANFEAGGPQGAAVLTDAQWRNAFDLYRTIEKTRSGVIKPEHAGAGTIIVATGGAAKASKDAGHSDIATGAIVLGGVIIAVAAYTIIKKLRG